MMADNITEFKPKPAPSAGNDIPLDQIVQTCPECECQSWWVRADNVLECQGCNNTRTMNSEWVKRCAQYEPGVTKLADDTGLTAHLYFNEEFARRSVMKDVNKMFDNDTMAMVSAYDRDGFGRSWFGAFTEEQRQWCVEKLQQAIDHLNSTELGVHSSYRNLPADPDQGEFDYGPSPSTEK